MTEDREQKTEAREQKTEARVAPSVIAGIEQPVVSEVEPSERRGNPNIKIIISTGFPSCTTQGTGQAKNIRG